MNGRGSFPSVCRSRGIRATEKLPDMVQRAADALMAAKSSAEVLEARNMAAVAYSAAKAAGRFQRAKQAHDSLLAEVYRAQADALLIEATAKMRLADEYDAAQARGEVRRDGQRGKAVEGDNGLSGSPATTADLGLRRDEIHEARRLRNAEAVAPGVIERSLADMRARGEEPTKARLRREVLKGARPDNDPRALWLWGRLKDFERMHILSADPAFLLAQMSPQMRADARARIPGVLDFLQRMKEAK